MKIEKSALVKDVPKEVIFYAIELIGESLIQDSKQKFGDMPNFEFGLKPDKKNWRIKYWVTFSVYSYSFEWSIKETKNGILVRVVGETPGKWYEFLFDTESKLDGLLGTQWSAFCNFAIGYMTAVTYSKSRRKREVREHVRGARKKVEERKGRKTK